MKNEKTMLRTHTCGELRIEDVNKEVMRAFVIWRDALRYDKVRETKLKNLNSYKSQTQIYSKHKKSRGIC